MNDRKHNDRRLRLSPGVGLILSLLLVVSPALAVDGVIEINQAKALAGGVSSGDSAGFPVQITDPGSYRLTGNLAAASGLDGIVITAENVTLDLNGFELAGAAGLIADGISITGNNRNVEVRNGTVRNFTRHGVFTNLFSTYVRLYGVRVLGNNNSGIELQGVGNLVDGCTALSNGVGIRALDGSLIINSIARQNTGLGLSMSATTGYRSNVVTENNGGSANPQTTSAGIQLGTNLCGTNTTCP